MIEHRTIQTKPATEADTDLVTRLMHYVHAKLAGIAKLIDIYFDDDKNQEDLPTVAVFGSGDNFDDYTVAFYRLSGDDDKASMAIDIRKRVKAADADIALMCLPSWGQYIPVDTPADQIGEVAKTVERQEIVLFYAETKTGAGGSSTVAVTRGDSYTIAPMDKVFMLTGPTETSVGDFFNSFGDHGW